MINVKFEYNSDTSVAKYSLIKNDVLTDDMQINIPFEDAYTLAKFFDKLILLSSEMGYNKLLGHLSHFVDSHDKF